MTKTRMLTMLAVLIAAGAASAQTDSLRCDARQMRAESGYYSCLSRCDRRIGRNAARPAERQRDLTQADCEAKCTQHYDDDLARIGATAICAAPTPAPGNPAECEAHLLRIVSSNLRCHARCGRDRRNDGFDPAACLAGCQTRCETAHDEVNARAVCSAGRIGTSDPCAAP
ncbi:MAG: hypothetical protein U0802_25395 [Candidatus Binatia bacterium]